jgi:hypothetical protein
MPNLTDQYGATLGTQANPLYTYNTLSGAAVGVNNPYPSADQIRLWIQNGQGFSASTGKLTASGAITGAFSIFNPSGSGKALIVFSMKFNIGNNSYNNISYVSTDPALTAATILNRNAISATASIASATYSNVNQTQSGTTNDTVSGASNTPLQVLQNGDVFWLPAGRGVVFWSNLSAANAWSVSAQWIEA